MKKQVLMLIMVGILSFGAGALTVNSIKDDKDDNKQQSNQPSSQGQTSLSTSTSPTKLVKETDQYLNKEVTVEGYLVEISAGQFIVTGTEEKDKGAVYLDLSQTKTDPKPLLANQPAKTDGETLAGPKKVVVTGKFIRTNKGNTTIVVKELKQAS